jgi:hypothetical protein
MATETPAGHPSPLEEEVRYAIGEGPAKVVSISIPEGTLTAFRKLVGRRGLSTAVTAAIEREMRDRARDQHMEEFEREHGPITEEEQAEIDAIWASAAERDAQWRATNGR